MKRALGAVLVALVVAGCAPQAASQAPAVPSPSTGHPTLGPADVSSEDADALSDPDASEAVPVWTAESRQAVLEVATAALQAWARPDLPHDQWWSGLSGYLTAGARDVVVLTDPANIPVTSIAAVSLPDEGQTAYVGWVAAETNDGPWWVLVAWQPDGTWLVDRITRSHEAAA